MYRPTDDDIRLIRTLIIVAVAIACAVGFGIGAVMF